MAMRLDEYTQYREAAIELFNFLSRVICHRQSLHIEALQTIIYSGKPPYSELQTKPFSVKEKNSHANAEMELQSSSNIEYAFNQSWNKFENDTTVTVFFRLVSILRIL